MTKILLLLAVMGAAPVASAECKLALQTSQPLARDSDFTISFDKCPEVTEVALEGTVVLLNGSVSGVFVSTPSPRMATYRLSSRSADDKTTAQLTATWDRLSTLHERQPQTFNLALRDASGKLFAVSQVSVLTSLAIREVKLVRKEGRSAGLGELVDVRFYLGSHLMKALDLSSRQDLILFFDGRPVGTYDSSMDAGVVRFRLGVHGWSPEQSKALETSWKRLITELADNEPVSVAVGTLTGGTILQSADKLKFDRFDRSQLISGAVVGSLVLLVAGIGLARTKLSLLRQDGELPAGSQAKKAFSLARCQMAWWFSLVILVVVFHWIFVGELASLPPNILLLIGISAGTGYLARAVDGDQALVAQPSEGFLTDLLTKGGEPGLHRLQMIVWTVVLGSYFLGKFFQTLWAPDLDLNWIGLMGLVSGVYVGFKIPEKKTPEKKPTAGAPE